MSPVKAGIHRTNKYKVGWKRERALRPADGHDVALQRLAQRFQAPRRKLGQFIQKQYAAMRERYLAGTRPRAAATKPARLMVWCGARKGRVRTSASPSGSALATEQIRVISNDSSKSRRGKMDGSARASSVLPAPGGPFMSTLCEPAQATSSARLACSCP